MDKRKPNAYEAINSYVSANSAVSAVICSADDESVETEFIQKEARRAAEELLSCVIYLNGLTPPSDSEQLYCLACALAKPLPVLRELDEVLDCEVRMERSKCVGIANSMKWLLNSLSSRFADVFSNHFLMHRAITLN